MAGLSNKNDDIYRNVDTKFLAWTCTVEYIRSHTENGIGIGRKSRFQINNFTCIYNSGSYVSKIYKTDKAHISRRIEQKLCNRCKNERNKRKRYFMEACITERNVTYNNTFRSFPRKSFRRNGSRRNSV